MRVSCQLNGEAKMIEVDGDLFRQHGDRTGIAAGQLGADVSSYGSLRNVPSTWAVARRCPCALTLRHAYRLAPSGGMFRKDKEGCPGTVFAYGPEILGKCFSGESAKYRSIHMAPPPGRGFRRLIWGLQWLHGEEHRKQLK